MRNVILTIIVIAAAFGVVYYYSKKGNNKHGSRFDNNDVQHIDVLGIENVLDWCSEHITVQGNYVIKFLPNKETLELFKGKLNISAKEQQKCYYIIVVPENSDNIVLRKLVITGQLSDELKCVTEGKVYVQTVNID